MTAERTAGAVVASFFAGLGPRAFVVAGECRGGRLNEIVDRERAGARRRGRHAPNGRTPPDRQEKVFGQGGHSTNPRTRETADDRGGDEPRPAPWRRARMTIDQRGDRRDASQRRGGTSHRLKPGLATIRSRSRKPAAGLPGSAFRRFVRIPPGIDDGVNRGMNCP